MPALLKKENVCVVAGVLQNAQKEFFITKRALHKHKGGSWEFPGGKIEKNEKPELALQRELFEEIGVTLHVANLHPLTFISQDYTDFHLILLVYVCHVWEGIPAPKEDQLDSMWVSFREACDLLSKEDTPILSALSKRSAEGF